MPHCRSNTRCWPLARAVLGSLLLAVILSACLGDSQNESVATGTVSIDPTSTSNPAPSEPPIATATPTAPPVVDPNPTPTIASLPVPVQAAVDKAADIHNISPELITVLSFTERQWPSTALGCPQPGHSYAQIVTPGYQVELDVTGRRYTYHTDNQTTAIDCTVQ